MSQKRAKKNKELARRDNGPVARSGGPVYQGEFFPETIEVQKVSRFTGPIPPPHLLSEYDQVLPGLAARLVTLAEDEAIHRRGIQRRQMRLAEGGLLSAFVIAMTVILGGIFLIYEGATKEGIGSIIAALTSLLVVYLTRGEKKSSSK